MTTKQDMEICPLGSGEFFGALMLSGSVDVTQARKGSSYTGYDWTIYFVRTGGNLFCSVPYNEATAVTFWINPDRVARGFKPIGA